jgi:hypothetical protein
LYTDVVKGGRGEGIGREGEGEGILNQGECQLPEIVLDL